jgi:hypothetical protein
MTGRRAAFRQTFAWRSVRRSLLVAAVVGTVLNAINQGPEIFAGQWPNLWKLGLTYIVPFLVASFGGYSALRDRGADA